VTRPLEVVAILTLGAFAIDWQLAALLTAQAGWGS
tara:strand:+ start:10845 stop:10949 length:105 start_codon:yes stop_codon:yes gene_type:complete